MEVQWEEPPELALLAAGRKATPYMELAVALRQHPGRWAVVPDNGQPRTLKAAQSLAQNIRRGITKGFTKGEYETAVWEGKVWVRYAPPAAAQEGEAAPQDDADDAVASAPVVRKWAKEHGLDVPDRGRLPEDVFRRYAQAVNAGEVGLPVRSVRSVPNAGER